MAAAVSKHRKRAKQSQSAISQLEIRKLLDGFSQERDQSEKKRSHKKQWKPEELVGREIKIWWFLRDQRRFTWRMATVVELRNETIHVMHKVRWHDNKQVEWKNLAREKYAVPYVKLAKAKVPPLNHGPLRETRCMKQRPRAVTMTHAPAQRNSQDMDATERYLARARDCSLIRSSEGVAASSPRAGVSPKLTPEPISSTSSKGKTLSSAGSAKAHGARGDKDGADIEAVSCQRCGSRKREASMLLCDGCDEGWHMECLDKPLKTLPQGSWFCSRCLVNGAEANSPPPSAPSRGPASGRLPPPIQTADPTSHSRRPSLSNSATFLRHSPRSTSNSSPRASHQASPSPSSARMAGKRPLQSLSVVASGASSPGPASKRLCHTPSLKPPTGAGPGGGVAGSPRRGAEASPSWAAGMSPMASARAEASPGRPRRMSGGR